MPELVVNHEYLLQQLRPYEQLARNMGDPLIGYLLGMVIEHCDDLAHPKPEIPRLARWDYDPYAPYKANDR